MLHPAKLEFYRDGKIDFQTSASKLYLSEKENPEEGIGCKKEWKLHKICQIQLLMGNITSLLGAKKR